MGRGNARRAILFGLDCDTPAACDMHGLYTEWRWRESVWIHMPAVCCMPATGNNSGSNKKTQREVHNADDNADAAPSNAPQSNNATTGCYVMVNGSIEEANVGEKAASLPVSGVIYGAAHGAWCNCGPGTRTGSRSLLPGAVCPS